MTASGLSKGFAAASMKGCLRPSGFASTRQFIALRAITIEAAELMRK